MKLALIYILSVDGCSCSKREYVNPIQYRYKAWDLYTYIRRFLPKSAAITVANAIVGSRINYCNSLHKACFDYNLLSLQGIQNSLCHMVTRTSIYDTTVCQRINFKWCLLVFRCIQTSSLSSFRFELLFLYFKHKAQQPFKQLSYNSLL